MSAPTLTLARVRTALAHPALIQDAADSESVNPIGRALLSFGLPGRAAFAEFLDKIRAVTDWNVPDAAQWWEHHFDEPAAAPQSIILLAQRLGWSDDALDVEKQAPQSVTPKRGELQKSGQGAAISNTLNAVTLLENQRNVSFHFDPFLDKVMVQWPDEAGARPIGDHDVTRAQIELQAFGMSSMSSASTRDAINHVARKFKCDSLVTYLESLKWDGVNRLTWMLTKSLGVEPSRLHMHAGRNLMTAAVARGMHPGCKVDEMLVLEGAQGMKKSQWWEALGEPFYAELTADPHSKDLEQQLRGKWFSQLSELNVLGRGDIERIKAFITCKSDHYRPSYGREARDYPRRCVFGGTTNSDEWLHDPTGGRRFIPIRVGEINLRWLKENRDQLFAEAVVLYKRGHKWWYFPKVATQAAQADRMPDDPWLAPIREYLYGRPVIVDIAELLQQAVDMPVDRQTKAHMTRAGLALKSLGCVRMTQRRVDGDLRRPWSVPEQFACKPCRRSGPVLSGAEAFGIVLSAPAAAASDLI